MWPFAAPYPASLVSDIAGRDYDYIVVGGGTAGCAVASRLSEEGDASVLLLERGRVADHWLSRIPLVSGGLARLFQVVKRVSEPIEGLGGRRTDIYAGEALGGSSRVNQMLWTRGVPAVYNEWAAMGNPDWSWDTVEPFFKRIENATGRPAARHLGHEGPVQLTKNEAQFALYSSMEASAAALGLPVEHDANDPRGPASGYFRLDSTIDRNGARHSAYDAYLPQGLARERRSHLTVCTGAVASRLQLDSASQTATGVHVKRAGSKAAPVFVGARREVVVCGGAIGSPQLLMLSGVGPEGHLQARGIAVQRHLPGVGQSLSDHHGIPVMMKVPWSETFHRLQQNIFHAIWQLLLFAWNKTGLLKSGTTAATIYVNTSHLDPDTSTLKPSPSDGTLDSTRPENAPDVEIMVIPASTLLDRFPGVPLCTLYTCLVQPETTGDIQLVSTDPEAHPRINYRALASQRDYAVARKALRFTLHLADHFVKSSGFGQPAELFYAPNAETGRDWKDLTDDELDEFSRQSVQSALHLGCTCRMGDQEAGGVVNGRLQVHGFTNLRVADASIFPKIPAAHTMAPTYMVAERCAQFIKDTWKEKCR